MQTEAEKGTNVIAVERLPVCRVFKQKSLKAKDLTDGLLREGGEHVHLQVVDVVVANRLLEDRVELVQDLDPCI